MATKISWADETWSPIIGCSKISAGCANCYAEKMAVRLLGMDKTQDRYWPVMTHESPYGWNGKTNFHEPTLTKPLHWRNPRKIFVCSMSDLFHESVPFEWIDRVFAVMALCPQHQFMCLTKRAGRMNDYYQDVISSNQRSSEPTPWPLPNVHLGVTVENQDNVGRIADLVRTPAAKRFVSFEPLLERIAGLPLAFHGIDYAFIGCESGPKARLCTIHNIEHIMMRCREVGVKIHVKQIPLNGECNKNIEEWPEEFRIREV